MIFSDRDIAKALDSGRIEILPFDPGCVQPSSVDLHLGDSFVLVRWRGSQLSGPIDVATGSLPEFPRATLDALELCPGDFILGTTAETVRLGDDVVAHLDGKSTLARLGIAPHVEAGFIDPGFSGQITLELSTVAHPVVLRAGMRICQISFEELSSPAARPYGSAGLGSHYQGQVGAQEACVTPIPEAASITVESAR